MTVQPINLSISKPSEPVKKTDPWAILSVLFLIRDTLAKGQQKLANSTERLIENGFKMQDKQLRDMKVMGKIELEAVKKEIKSNTLKDIAIGLTIVAMVIVVGATAMILPGSVAGLASIFSLVLSLTAGGLYISADVIKIDSAEKLMEVAEAQESVSVDEGLNRSNSSIVDFVSNTLRDAMKAQISVQKTVTEVINSTGSAMQIAAR